jgi:hypothetical protein
MMRAHGWPERRDIAARQPMRGSLLATLRGSDGRSLARAFICLLLFNAILAGWHSGAAAVGAGMAICSAAETGGGDPAGPARNENAPCCKAGCLSSAIAISDPPPSPEAPAWRLVSAAPVAGPAPPVTAPRILDHGPRGPPPAA